MVFLGIRGENDVNIEKLWEILKDVYYKCGVFVLFRICYLKCR